MAESGPSIRAVAGQASWLKRNLPWLVNNYIDIQTGSNRRHALTDLRPQCVNVPNRIGVDSIKQRAGFLNLLFEFTVIGDISKIERIQKSAKLLDGGFPQLLGLTRRRPP